MAGYAGIGRGANAAYKPPGANGETTTVKTALDRLIKPRVNGSVSRKIVFAGSSTAAGQGAPGDNGWAQRIGADLTARGWTVSHKSVGGNHTQSLIDRFHADIALQAPDVCVIALTLGNEGIQNEGTIAGKETMYARYTGNLKKLVWMCRQNHIIPVFADVTPNDAYSADDYKFLRSVHRWLDGQAVANISWLDLLEDGAGHWRAAFYVDGIHGNGAAHDAMYYAVPVSFFDSLTDWNEGQKMPLRRAGWKTTGAPTSIPLKAVFDTPMRSYTVAFRLTTAERNKGVWGVNNNAIGHALRINTAGGGLIAPATTFGLHNGVELLGSGVPVDGREHHFVVVYDHAAQTIRLYIDGNLVITTAYQQDELIHWMTFLDRGAGTTPILGTINDVLIYRTAHTAAAVKAIFDGDIPKGSLEVMSPLGDPETALYSRATNYAQTASYLFINSAGVVIDANGASAKSQAARVIREAAADPVVADFADKSWGIWKNTTSGAVKLWVNDGGVLKSATVA